MNKLTCAAFALSLPNTLAYFHCVVRGRSAKKSKRNLRRLEHRNNLLRNDFALPKEAFETRNVESYVDTELKSRQSLYDQQPPYECYWCCKAQQSSRPVIVPATPKPVTTEPFSWAPFPVTNRPAAVWTPGMGCQIP